MRVGGVSVFLCLGGALLAWRTPGAEPGTAAPPLVGLPFDAGRAHSLQSEWAKASGLDREVTNSVGMRLAPNGFWGRTR